MKLKFKIGALSIGTLVFPFISSCNYTSPIQEVHIFHINDSHGNLPGYGDDFYEQPKDFAGAIRVVRDIRNIAKDSPGSLFVSAGDDNSMGSFANCNNGESSHKVMSAMDISYSAVGNHLWDYGNDNVINKKYDLWSRTPRTEGNYFITSNILDGNTYREKTWAEKPTDSNFESDYNLWKQKKIPWADPYKIVDLNGNKVCIIGLTTNSIYWDGKLEVTKNLTVCPYLASINYAKKLALEEKGQAEFDAINSFILLTHIGIGQINKKGAPNDPEEFMDGVDIAKAVDSHSNIDAILCAHSHIISCGKVHNNNLNKDIWLGEAGWKCQAFCDTKLTFNNNNKPGHRLESISMRVVKPSINDDSWQSAHDELETLSQQTTDPIVKNTINKYNEQKEITKQILGKVLGHTNNGLPYSYTGGGNTRGYQSPTIVDKAGAWATKSRVGGFNIQFKNEIQEGKMYPVSIAIDATDSIGGGIDSNHDILERDLYKLYQFEQHPVYATLTYHQLEQLCNYIISGKCNYPDHDYLDPIYYDNEHKQRIYEEGQGPGIPWNPYQWYGFGFNSIKEDGGPSSSNQWRQYKYNEKNKLRVFDPTDNAQTLEDPTTWKDNSDGYWDNRMIGICVSNFIMFNRCDLLNKLATYNARDEQTKTQIRYYQDIQEKELARKYCADIKSKSISIDISNLDDLIHIPK